MEWKTISITVFTVFRLLTDFVCLYNYEFGLSLSKIVRSSVILLLPLFTCLAQALNTCPRVFIKIMKCAFSDLPKKGHFSTAYIDDSL